MSQIRVLAIGAGAMANSVHYPSLSSLDDVEIVGICDTDAARVAATADRWGVKGRYPTRQPDDYQKVVRELKPDAVYAIGQPNIMYPIWQWCLENGQNLYIEKPLGLSVHQARALAYLAEKHRCITQVSFQRRSCPMVVQLHAECLKRGPITHAVCEFYKYSPEPFLGPRDHMMDDGVHAIDTLRWICGGEVGEIQAITRRVGVPDINFFAVLLRFDNGSTGVLLNSWTSGRRVFRVQMHAPGISVEAEHEAKGALYADGDTEGVWYDTREAAGSNENYVSGGYLAKNREFIDCLKSGQQPSSNFSDAVKTMEVADKILAMAVLQGP